MSRRGVACRLFHREVSQVGDGVGCWWDRVCAGRSTVVSRSGGLETDGDAAKQCGVRACRGKSGADACGGFGDAPSNFKEAHPQGGKLGRGERMRL
jgi:hypothetical protein